MSTPEAGKSSEIEQLIEQAHLALLRRDLDTAASRLKEALEIDPNNSEALQMVADIHKVVTEHERDVRIAADDLRIKKEQDEAWKRDQAYKNQQLIDSILHPDFGRRMDDIGWDVLLDFLLRR